MSDPNRNALAGSIVGLVSLLAVAAFLIIGFTFHVWHPAWMVFFVIPIASILTDITIKRSAAGAVTGIVWLLSTAAFLYLGFEYGKWHPGWLVFFAVPIADILMKILTRSSGTGGGCCGSSDIEQKG